MNWDDILLPRENNSEDTEDILHLMQLIVDYVCVTCSTAQLTNFINWILCQVQLLQLLEIWQTLNIRLITSHSSYSHTHSKTYTTIIVKLKYLDNSDQINIYKYINIEYNCI